MLRAIQILTEWIEKENKDRLTESGKEHLVLLQERVRRMDDIIDGVTEYAHIGREEIRPEPVDFNQLIDYVITVRQIPDHIQCTILKSLPVVTCKRSHMKQVFQHLIDNAVKYMDKPNGEIKIDFCKNEGFWQFSVADNGPGIAEKHFNRIFKICQTLHSKDEIHSRGMGLTLSKRIIEQAGGRIWVDSKEGEGSTFFFTLPRDEAQG